MYSYVFTPVAYDAFVRYMYSIQWLTALFLCDTWYIYLSSSCSLYLSRAWYVSVFSTVTLVYIYLDICLFIGACPYPCNNILLIIFFYNFWGLFMFFYATVFFICLFTRLFTLRDTSDSLSVFLRLSLYIYVVLLPFCGYVYLSSLSLAYLRYSIYIPIYIPHTC